MSAIGPVGRGDTLRPASRSTEAAAKVMPACGVSRILTISAAPLNHSCEALPFLLSRVASPLLTRLLPAVYADLEAMEVVLRLGDLDWTAVRPPRLTDRRPRGRYRYDLEAGPRGNSISRADLARAMLDFLAVPETIGHAVGVSW